MRLALPWRSGSAPPPVEPARFRQASRALSHVVRRLEATPRSGVLDLGLPLAANLALYSRHRARITFADYFRFKPSPRPRGGARDGLNGPDLLLPRTPSSFDIVFAWDLLDYLSLEEIDVLGQAVSARSSPGAMLLALAACQGSMPAAPSRYTIVDDESLLYEASGPAAIPSPAHSEKVISRSLPGFTLESRFQLRHGMVEYLFIYR